MYKYNRFQACRYGVGGAYIDAQTQQRATLQRDILDTLELLRPHARTLDTEAPLSALRSEAEASRSDAAWLRDAYQKLGSLNDVARRQSEQWMGSPLNA